MAKPDQVAAIKAANGVELNVDHYTAKNLEVLEALAEKDGKDNLTAFQVKQKEFDDERAAQNPQGQGDAQTQTSTSTSPSPSAGAAAKEPKAKTVTVRVNDKIAAYGGAFSDPETRETIGKEAVEVTLTAFVRGLLRSEDIVEED